MNKIKYNLSILTKQNLDYNSDLVNIDEKPPLPENMIANNKDFEEVDEFTGFIPEYLPDKIVKVKYSFQTSHDHLNLIFAHYYTTYKKLDKILKNKDEEKIDDKNEINEETKENKNEETEDEEKTKIYFRSKIEDNEEKFCTKLIKFKKDIHSSVNQIVIINDIKDEKDEKEKKDETEGKLMLIRVILFSMKEVFQGWHGKYGEKYENYCMKFNYYFPDYSNGIIRKSDDIFSVYRRNAFLDFIKENNLQINLNTNAVGNSLDDSNGMSD